MDRLVSVIVPVYNVEQYLSYCLNSIINQSYHNLEIIIVDDGATDGSASICERYARIDNRIIVIHKENGGLSSARNAGLDISRGDFVVFVDSDDYVSKDYIITLLNNIVENNSDIAMCNFYCVDDNSKRIIDNNSDCPIHDQILSKKQGFEKLTQSYSAHYVVAWNKMYKKEIFTNIRFPEKKIHEDEYIIHEVFNRCNKISCIKEPLYFYRKRTGSIMSKESAYTILDRDDALLNRAVFFMENGMKEYAQYFYMRSFWEFYEQIDRLDFSNQKHISKYNRVYSNLVECKYIISGSKYTKEKLVKMFNLFGPRRANWLIKTKRKIWDKCNVFKELSLFLVHEKGKDCILIDTPIHGNLGDQAICLAEQQFLHSIGITYYELPAEKVDCKEKYYGHLVNNKSILVHGGGFLGNLWPEEEHRFRRILKNFSQNRIIVFPQTITFDLSTTEGASFFEESYKAYSDHPNLTICVREENSYLFMRKYMPKVSVVLIPDMVMQYDTEIYDKKRDGIILCFRSDREKALPEQTLYEIKKALRNIYPASSIYETDTVINKRVTVENRKKCVNEKLLEFATAKLVVTDRLHGMVFAAITNTPCIAFNNANGKVKNVYNWLKKCSYIRYVEYIDDINSALLGLDIEKAYHYPRTEIKKKFLILSDIIRKEKNE